MHGWYGVCVDGVWSFWRGLISRKLGLFVVLCCYCFIVGWVGELLKGWVIGCMVGMVCVVMVCGASGVA